MWKAKIEFIFVDFVLLLYYTENHKCLNCNPPAVCLTTMRAVLNDNGRFSKAAEGMCMSIHAQKNGKGESWWQGKCEEIKVNLSVVEVNVEKRLDACMPCLCHCGGRSLSRKSSDWLGMFRRCMTYLHLRHCITCIWDVETSTAMCHRV